MSPHLGVVSLALLLCSCTCTTVWEHVINIDSERGNNTQECIDGRVPCMNLSFAFEYRRSSTQYILHPGTHYLDNSTYNSPFTNLSNFAIVGNGSDSSDTIIECNAPNSGLAFIAVSNVYLERVTFSHCAGLRNSTSRDFSSVDFAMQKTQAALYFYLCSNVSMNLVTVTNSCNATGVIMYNTTGSNMILESTFSNNSVGVNSPYPGGGGFYVEFPYCAPGDENCTNEESNTTANHNATYFFSNCAFAHNKADSIDRSNHSTYILPLGRNHIAFGRGGGLSIFFNGCASGNRVNISNCHFENNTALWGGGLFVEFHDSAGDNHVTVSGSILTGNKCFITKESGTGGGGMRIGHYVYKGAVGPAGNRIVLSGCHFSKNSALNGGALSISPTLQDTVVHQLAFINISLCYFEDNMARLGAAVHIAKFALIVTGSMLSINFTQCHFRYNSIHYVHKNLPYQTGVGSVYVNEVLVSFRETASFKYNHGSALAIVGTVVDFMHCNAFFSSNHGDKGGGIALLGASVILVNDSTFMFFDNNTAEIHGGAIYNKYIERENFATYANCFIRHYDPTLHPNAWKVKFYFDSNYDSNGTHKNAIYSTSILPCTWAGGLIADLTSEILCLDPFQYNCSEELSSEAGNITIVDNNTLLKTFPGQPIHLPLVIVDDLKNNVSTQTVFIATSNDKTVAEIEPSYTYASGETLVVTGIENQSFILELDSAGDRVWHVQFTVELQSCPPGFRAHNTNSSSTCVCSPNKKLGSTVHCDITSFNASLSNGYWMGVLPDYDNIVVALCPSSFCYTDPSQNSFPLPNSIDELDAFICGRIHRTGILCGGCEDGYGPAVNSETHECVLCNGTNIAANAVYYVLSVYLPLTVLFAVIILFNIRLTTGPANAFIIYSQVVASTFNLDAGGQIPLNTITSSGYVTKELLMAYRVPYGIFNLEFIENIISPLCLGTKLNTLDVIALNYGVAVFPLLMIIVIVLFIKLKGCFAVLLQKLTPHRRASIQSCLQRNWRIGDGLVHVFAAFVLLSYNKFCLVSSFLVQYQPFYDEDGNEIGRSRVYFNANYTSTDTEYIFKYCLPASIFFATFVAIPPLLLLGYPVKWLEWCLSKVECLWRFYPVDKVHILLDTFQGCYRNKMRFFAGLYFLFRLIFYVTYIVTDTYIQQFIIQQVTCTVFIVLISLCQPYTKDNKIFNYVDMLMFTNLAILNALSWYLYHFAQDNPGQPLSTSVFVIQYILVFLPLLYMIAYILYDLSSPCHQKIQHYIKETFHMRIRCLFRKLEYHHLDGIVRDDASTNEGTQIEDDVEALFERAETENTYRPSPVNLPATEVHTYPTGMRPRGSPSEDSGLRSHQSSINNYGSTASRTVSMQTPPDSSGQTTGSSNKIADNS